MGRIDHLDVKSLAASLAESGDARIDGLVRADATRSSHAGSAFPTEGGVVGPSGGVAPVLPVDLYIPGCPPRPLDLLTGLLRLFRQPRAGDVRAQGL